MVALGAQGDISPCAGHYACRAKATIRGRARSCHHLRHRRYRCLRLRRRRPHHRPRRMLTALRTTLHAWRVHLRGHFSSAASLRVRSSTAASRRRYCLRPLLARCSSSAVPHRTSVCSPRDSDARSSHVCWCPRRGDYSGFASPCRASAAITFLELTVTAHRQRPMVGNAPSRRRPRHRHHLHHRRLPRHRPHRRHRRRHRRLRAQPFPF